MVDRTSGQEMNVSWTPLTLVEVRGIIGNYTVYWRRRRSEETEWWLHSGLQPLYSGL